MVNNIPTQKKKEGLFRFGFVTNLREATYVKELHDYLDGSDEEPTSMEIRRRADTSPMLFFNEHGYPQGRDKKPVDAISAKFKAFNSEYKNADGKDVYGWFEKNEDTGIFEGVSWGSIEDLRAYASFKETMHHSFRMGEFYFENSDSCDSFLENVASKTIPESWQYKSKQTRWKYPILKSYLEHVFTKLKREGKVLRNYSSRYIIFNTNLLDRYFNALYIIAEVRKAADIEVYYNPVVVSKESHRLLLQYGFEDVNPEPPMFFNDINEVVFNTHWKIDKDFGALSHIIEERIERFPVQWRTKSPDILARRLYEAIDYAVAIAQRNYKYIVPIYYPRFDSISFLMPIFLEGAYNVVPDFALVLQTDKENNIYIARTILDLESGYQDARLIAKPDESWLNPLNLK